MKKRSASERVKAADSHGSDSDRHSALEALVSQTRGQTTIDFTVGVVLFVFVLVAIFAFVAGTVEPFTAGDQEDVVTVNRVADGLSGDTLGDPNTPYTLTTACTRAFFNRTSSPPSNCRFSVQPLEDQVGVTGSAFLNVTVRGNVSGSGSPDELLCWDGTTGDLVEQSGTDCTVADVEPLTVGDDAESGAQSSVTARRTVSLDGTSVSLVVKLW